MKPHYLTPLFAPRTIAVIGASDTQGSVGQRVFSHLLAGSFKGQLFPINHKRNMVAGVKAYATVQQIEVEALDLVVVTTPIRSLPAVIRGCAKKGVKTVLIARGLVEKVPMEASVLRETVALAQAAGIRLLGPNIFGLMRPVAGLNASTYSGAIQPGNLALVAQSSALCSAMLDWADNKDIGFSSVIALGRGLDVGVGEVLDYLVADPFTQGILLHVHDIQDVRRFMSALRAAARTKPVVVLKSGHYEQWLEAKIYSSKLINSKAIFDAALSRAGVLQVNTVNQLFTAAKMLAANYRVCGKRLAIVSNGEGPGALAADSAVAKGLDLVALAPETIKLLNNVLPDHWSGGNPVDILGDASPSRFRSAVKACLDDPNVDGVLVIFTPQAEGDHLVTAQLMVGLQRESSKPLLLSWLGDSKVAESQALFYKAKCAYFPAPEDGVEVFCHLADYQKNQQLLLQTPAPLEGKWAEPNLAQARALVEAALRNGRTVLSERESKAILSAFHIPVNETRLAANKNQVLKAATQLGYPLVMKIDSPDILYKSDVGGVELSLSDESALCRTFDEMMQRVRQLRPDARLDGVTIQPMRRRRLARELMVGVVHDPIFGPVIAFGAGGIAMEVMNDVSLSLPPLNHYLIERLIEDTRIGRLLGPFKNLPAVNSEALKEVLLRVSEMVCELPELLDVDINPLLLDEKGAIVLDARMILAQPDHKQILPYAHMAIMPYPVHQVRRVTLNDGTVVKIRPIRPEDAKMQQAFVRNLSEESRYNRYLSSIKQLSQNMLVRFTQLDYDREMALVMIKEGGEEEEMLAVARFITDPDNEACEFSLEVADQWQAKGIGALLMNALFEAAKAQGRKFMHGEVLTANKGMVKLMQKLGFELKKHPEEHTLTWVNKVL